MATADLTQIIYDPADRDTAEQFLGDQFTAWGDDDTIQVTFPDGFEALVYPGDTIRRTDSGALEIWNGPNHP